jgi:hypothetical protein
MKTGYPFCAGVLFAPGFFLSVLLMKTERQGNNFAHIIPFSVWGVVWGNFPKQHTFSHVCQSTLALLA